MVPYFPISDELTKEATKLMLVGIFDTNFSIVNLAQSNL